MTDFYKVIENGYLIGIGTNGPDTVETVTEAEYGELLTVILNAPTAPEGHQYLLRADTLEWELAELPDEGAESGEGAE